VCVKCERVRVCVCTCVCVRVCVCVCVVCVCVCVCVCVHVCARCVLNCAHAHLCGCKCSCVLQGAHVFFSRYSNEITRMHSTSKKKCKVQSTQLLLRWMTPSLIARSCNVDCNSNHAFQMLFEGNNCCRMWAAAFPVWLEWGYAAHKRKPLLPTQAIL
jgi:hypothetical protein